MSLKTILTQKIRDPLQKKQWLELMQIKKDDESDESPSIYWKGTLADKGAIKARHLDLGCVTNEALNRGVVDGRVLADNSVESRHLSSEITFPSSKIADKAINGNKIAWPDGSIFDQYTNKPDPNVAIGFVRIRTEKINENDKDTDPKKLSIRIHKNITTAINNNSNDSNSSTEEG